MKNSVFNRLLIVSLILLTHAVHSAQADPLKDELLKRLEEMPALNQTMEQLRYASGARARLRDTFPRLIMGAVLDAIEERKDYRGFQVTVLERAMAELPTEQVPESFNTATPEELAQLGRLKYLSRLVHINWWIHFNLSTYIEQQYDTEYAVLKAELEQEELITSEQRAEMMEQLAEKRKLEQRLCMSGGDDLIEFAGYHQWTAREMIGDTLEKLNANEAMRDIYPQYPGIIYNPKDFPEGGFTPFAWSPERPWDMNAA